MDLLNNSKSFFFYGEKLMKNYYVQIDYDTYLRLALLSNYYNQNPLNVVSDIVEQELELIIAREDDSFNPINYCNS